MNVTDFIGKEVKYDPAGQMIFGIDREGNEQLLLDVRGWGRIQYLDVKGINPEQFQDDLGEWIADAINEKLRK